MIPVLYPPEEEEFEFGALGWLTDALSCKATEETETGACYLEITYPVDGNHYSDIAIGCQIKTASDPATVQVYCIERIDYSAAGTIDIYAPQRTLLRMQKTVLLVKTRESDDGSEPPSYTNRSARNMMLAMAADALPKPIDSESDLQDVEFISDITYSSGSEVTVELDDYPTMFDALIAMAKIFKGEIKWGINSVSILRSRGVDSGLEIRYGLNMLALDAETDAGNYVTAIYPVARGYTGQPVKLDTTNGFPFYRGAVVDVSDYWGTGMTIQDAAQAYLAAQGINPSIKVEFDSNDLPNVDADPERIRNLYLCDSVTVVHKGLQLKENAKISKAVFDSLLMRYESLDVGEIQQNITDTIAALIRGNKKG